VGAVVIGLSAVKVVPSMLGRTPPSGFLTDAFGEDALVFNETYEGTGSSEDRFRIVIVDTDMSPDSVLGDIADRGGWRPVGKGIERRSDGLCVVARTTDGYLGIPGEDSAERRPKLMQQRSCFRCSTAEAPVDRR
jgi:hypothetical protein